MRDLLIVDLFFSTLFINVTRGMVYYSSLLSCVYTGNVEHNVVHNVVHNVECNVAPYLLTLANGNDPISVALPKVANASKVK
jgi:hypothetical protein